MRTVRLSDMTMKQKAAQTLTFKEKIELVRLLDRVGADVIEMDRIVKIKADSLCVKSVADAVSGSIVAVPSGPDRKEIDVVWEALKGAVKPRIQIEVPVSLVQMEYMTHEKPDTVLRMTADAVAYAASLTKDVELIAKDATRSEEEFLYALLGKAVASGATTVTVCDTAGILLPMECGLFVRKLRENVPGIKNVTCGVMTSSSLSMADACAMEAILAGAGEIKTAICEEETSSLVNMAKVISLRGAEASVSSNVRTVELQRVHDKAFQLFHAEKNKLSPFEDGVSAGEGNVFTAHDDIAAIVRETERLGYDLSEEDRLSVYEAFRKVADKKKEGVTSREIDAIVASNALQVPSAYKLEDYIINSGSLIAASSHIRLRRGGAVLDGIALGDGPVDASFLAIEQITGRHFELDDFQIRAVTEGREAMGETIVKLRSEGRVYAGRGLSTDIIGSSILAYMNALNKLIYEEENA